MQRASSYIKHLQHEGKAYNTLVTYQYHLKAFYNWLQETSFNIENLTPKDLLIYKEWILILGKSPRTVNAMISCVRGFYDYLILKEIVEINPVSKALHIDSPVLVIKPLSEAELHEFENFIDQLQENLRAGFYLMIATGMRVGEVASLHKTDFRTYQNKLLVNITGAKWESDREIPVLSGKIAQIVSGYVDDFPSYTEPVFRVSKRTFQNYATKFGKQTGVDFSCHVLRHTFATNLSNKGVAIQQIQHLLGHKTSNMTQHYIRTAHSDILSMEPIL